MRPLEITLIVVCGVLLFAAPKLPRLRRWLVVGGLAVLIAHSWLEGVRWQMAPAYVVMLLVTGWVLLLSGTVTSGWLGRFGRTTAFLALLLSLVAGLLFPIPRLPDLAGPYAVGTSVTYLRDDTRTDPYAPQPDAPRELMVQVWYPAVADSGAPPAPYLDYPDVAAQALSQFFGLPPLILGHLNLIETHALAEPAAATDGPFPLLIFSHGWTGFRAQTSFLLEELASQGYIVAAIDHSYAAAFTVFPGDRVAPLNPNALAGDGSDPVAARNALVRQWATDVGFVIDQLAAQSDAVYAGQIDFDRLGVMGHSTGGGSTVEFCGSDPRCQVVVGLDTWAMPVSDDVIAAGLSQPTLMLFSQLWPLPDNVARIERLRANASGTTFLATIMGTDHYDFTNTPFLTPLAARLGLKGPLPGRRVVTIVNEYVTAFLDDYLKGVETSLLDGNSAEYPEVKFDFLQEN